MGQYQNERGRTFDSNKDLFECFECPAGFYAEPDDGLRSTQSFRVKCLSCKPGKFGENTSAAREEIGCTNCPTGRYSSKVSFVPPTSNELPCTACPRGTYNSKSGQITGAVCKPCVVGKYSNRTGESLKTACKKCLVGRYNPMAGAGNADDCILCPPGEYGNGIGLGFCLPCLQGFRNELHGQIQCTQCLLGRYTEEIGSKHEACTLAPRGRYASIPTSSLIVIKGFKSTNCLKGDNTAEAQGCSQAFVCLAGKYGDDPPSGLCHSCPSGYFSPRGYTNCLGKNTLVVFFLFFFLFVFDIVVNLCVLTILPDVFICTIHLR